MAQPVPDTRCGFVSVLGLPNAGKSTLVNRMVGTKVSIVSPKVQTTRTRVLGIAMRGQAQVILIDTPGIFKPRKRLEQSMVAAAQDTIGQADLIVHLVDATRKNAVEENRVILQRLAGIDNTLLALNKTDKAAKPELLKLAEALNKVHPYKATFMISGLSGDGVDDLLGHLVAVLPPGPWHFPEDQAGDMPMRLLAAEITREQVFNRLHRELPHAALVETEQWEEFGDGSVKISQLIYVERDSQKAIVLGKGGRQIKAIGQAARAELEDILERRVHLKLFVKTEKNWQDKAEFYRLMGLEFAP